MTRPMHDTLSAVKTASLDLDNAIKTRDEEIATACPELEQLTADAAAARAQLAETRTKIEATLERVDAIKAKHAQVIADAEGVLVAARNARKVHLAAQPKKVAKA